MWSSGRNYRTDPIIFARSDGRVVAEADGQGVNLAPAALARHEVDALVAALGEWLDATRAPG